MQERPREESPRYRCRRPDEIIRAACGYQLAPALSRARPEVDHVPRPADRFLIVLDHDKRVALRLQPRERIEQDAVVARMKADRRLVEHVANPAQVGAELRREADALRFAAGERGRGTIESEIGEPHFAQEREAASQLGGDVPGDLRFPSLQAQIAEKRLHGRYRQAGEIGDGVPAEPDRKRGRVEPVAVARRAQDAFPCVPLVPPDLLAALLFIKAGELRAGAVAALAPAVLRVVGEEPGIELGEARAARGAGALRREYRLGHHGERGVALRHGVLERFQGREHVRGAVAELERSRNGRAQFGLALRRCAHVGNRQLDPVLVKARETRPGVGRDKRAVDAQVRVALAARPLGEIRVVALAIDYQRRKQADPRAAMLAQDARGDRVKALRLDRDFALRTVLHAELDEEQAQEMVDLGQRPDGGLAPAAARALLDRDRGRNAVDRVHVGTRGGLDELARIGIERLEVAALAFRKDDVKRERGLAGARDPGDDGEAVARKRNVDVLQVVLARAVHLDGAIARPLTLTLSPEQGRGGIYGLPLPRAGGEGGGEGRPQRNLIIAQSLPGVGRRIRGDLRRGAGADDLAARVAALGAEIDDPVGGRDDIEVVLDDHQGVPGREELAERAQQLRHVVEMKAGGRLVEEE